MADNKLQEKLVDYVQDAHAMEQNVSTMLDSMIATTDDPEIKEMLEHHKRQTEEHERRLRERLDGRGAGGGSGWMAWGRAPRRPRTSGGWAPRSLRAWATSLAPTSRARTPATA